MPYLIQDLMVGRATPISVTPKDSLQLALALMIEHDFSQLPVVDPRNRPLGLITSANILRALKYFAVRVGDLRVSDVALSQVRSFGIELKVVDVLDEVLRQSAVLITDGNGELKGIITSHDTTEFFRRRAEDMMFVEDIEGLLKDFVRAAFRTPSGDEDETKLQEAILHIMPSNSELRGDFGKALKYYLDRSLGGDSIKIHQGHAQAAFDQHILKTSDPRPFDRLSMDEYIRLFLHDARWEMYEPIFGVGQAAIRQLLFRVRDSRNTLAHFRDELSPEQRDQLRFCMAWLESYELAIAVAFQHVEEPLMIEVHSLKVDDGPDLGAEEAFQVDEEKEADSRYGPLAWYLRQQSGRKSVALGFNQIEELIKEELPDTARRHRSWWTDILRDIESRQGLVLGWRVARVNASTEQVVFVPIQEREVAYTTFFNSMIDMLEQRAKFPLRRLFVTGRNSLNLTHMPLKELPHAYLNQGFSLGNRFRIELSIDVRHHYAERQQVNKAIFDCLVARKEQIERDFGAPLSWERLDDYKMSRVAAYHDGSINDGETKLTLLQDWAVEATLRFFDAISEPLAEAVQAVKAEYSQR